MSTRTPVPPPPHPSGARPPQIPADKVPRHVAIVMDGNGRWAKERGLKRIEGHARGEAVLMDVLAGAIEIGVKYVSAYAFSTENWKRSPDEVRWLMGFNRSVIARRRDEMDAMGIRVRWAGRRPKLWRSVIRELESAEDQSRENTTLTLQFCVNYGGRAEIVDAARKIARLARDGKLRPEDITESSFHRYLDEPDVPDVDLFIRSSGEQRTSNFLVWQSAYAEMVFLDTLWPDFDRRDLWAAIESYAGRDRRMGGAVPNVERPAAERPTIEDLTQAVPGPTGQVGSDRPGGDHSTSARPNTLHVTKTPYALAEPVAPGVRTDVIPEDEDAEPDDGALA